MILLVVITAGNVVVNGYLSSAYNLAFFQNGYSSMIGLIIVGGLWVIIAIINIIVTLTSRGKNLPKSLHNPKAIWIYSGVLAGVMLIFFMWFMSLGQKMAYTVTLNNAVSAMADTPGNEDVSLVLVRSERDCLRRRGCDEQYHNVFYVRNNLNQPKEMQIKIHAANNDQEEIKVIDSKIMKLDPGELKMVKTEETSDHIWSQYSFTTEEPVLYYHYNFRHRNPTS
ncbi:hypothetical protein SAMN04488072_103221 [Lentibacillus halodurans]|uniref:Uncharacterized protein n=1 Tax=Lentibacillus halodurans TaxID=237679 RepID=A0A1I0WQZ8_9BACI|nr:hypothetical protein [Lentibacillus halodurans]SFA91179.1 hypothetical protein SAMN04488072_103221 [Lentibacillus halodurans]